MVSVVSPSVSAKRPWCKTAALTITPQQVFGRLLIFRLAFDCNDWLARRQGESCIRVKTGTVLVSYI